MQNLKKVFFNKSAFVRNYKFFVYNNHKMFTEILRNKQVWSDSNKIENHLVDDLKKMEKCILLKSNQNVSMEKLFNDISNILEKKPMEKQLFHPLFLITLQR